MITKTVPYKDFDGEAKVAELSFHLSRTDIANHLDLEDQVREVVGIITAPEHTMTREEVSKYLEFVKRMMELSYGERYVEGGQVKFSKSADAYRRFQDSAVYDEFLWGLFVDPAKADAFVYEVLPKDFVEEAKAELEKPSPTELTDDQLRAMSPQDVLKLDSAVIARAFALKSQ